MSTRILARLDGRMKHHKYRRSMVTACGINIMNIDWSTLTHDWVDTECVSCNIVRAHTMNVKESNMLGPGALVSELEQQKTEALELIVIHEGTLSALQLEVRRLRNMITSINGLMNTIEEGEHV